MKQYHKIPAIFKRDISTKKPMVGEYTFAELKYLKDCEWIFTEKIDGTNIRVVWDGHKVEFYGRTDKAVIPNELLVYLENKFSGDENEEIFEQNFGNKQVIIYGEGYGGKIQNGAGYRDDTSFILFDVEIENVFLCKDNVRKIADIFNIDMVPIFPFLHTLGDAVEFMKTNPDSTIGHAKMEGVVGIPEVGVCDRLGNRIIVKIKAKDMNDAYGD